MISHKLRMYESCPGSGQNTKTFVLTLSSLKIESFLQIVTLAIIIAMTGA